MTSPMKAYSWLRSGGTAMLPPLIDSVLSSQSPVNPTICSGSDSWCTIGNILFSSREMFLLQYHSSGQWGGPSPRKHGIPMTALVLKCRQLCAEGWLNSHPLHGFCNGALASQRGKAKLQTRRALSPWRSPVATQWRLVPHTNTASAPGGLLQSWAGKPGFLLWVPCL